MRAEFSLNHGRDFPFDAGEVWWNGKGDNPPAAVDRSHAAARGIFADLTDRRGIKQTLNELSHPTRAALVKQVAHVIRSTPQEGNWPVKATHDLLDVVKRHGTVQHAFDSTDVDVQEELAGELAIIVRLAMTI